MPIIDSDAHVIECEATWEYMTGKDRDLRPTTVVEQSETGEERRFWLIDGRVFPRDGNIASDVSRESRELTDIPGRLKHMDELEIDLAVLYPSLFLRPLTPRPSVDLALARSYNRWLADIWAHSDGRLRWAAVPPLLSMEETAAELEFCRDHGACAIFMHGVVGGRTLDDPFFWPLYDAASELSLPLGIHSGNGDLELYEQFQDGWMRNKLCTIGSFQTLLNAGVPQRFPKLRIGYVETGAQWVPYALHDMAKRKKIRGVHVDMPSVLRENRIWVACQTDDDVSYVLSYTGEDNVVIGSDYGHNDTATELDALRHIQVEQGIPATTIQKILDDNPRALYGL